MVAKAGTRFENVSKLFDHAAHNGSNYLNGHCFVSIMLCIPVWKNDRMSSFPNTVQKVYSSFVLNLSQGIRSQIFLTNFVRNIETHIKSNVIIKALKQLIRQQVY